MISGQTNCLAHTEPKFRSELECVTSPGEVSLKLSTPGGRFHGRRGLTVTVAGSEPQEWSVNVTGIDITCPP